MLSRTLLRLLLLLACAVPAAEGLYRRLFAWGHDRYAQRGVGGQPTVVGQAAATSNCTPTQVTGLNWAALQPLGLTLDRVIPGLDHNVALTKEYVAYVWGRNDKGQLGVGDTNDRSVPVPLALADVRDACAGQLHTLFLTGAGAVYAAGGNAQGQLGTGAPLTTNATTPVSVAALAALRVTAVACGTAHSLALTSEGDVYAWGDASFGQTGQGTDPCAPPAAPGCALLPVLVPTRVRGLPPAKLIAAGGGFAGGAVAPGSAPAGGHSLVVSRDGDEVWAFGDNFYGQLGVPHQYTSIAPFSMAVTPFDFDGQSAAAVLTAAPPSAALRMAALIAAGGNASNASNASNATVDGPLAYATLAQYLAGESVRPLVTDVAPARVTSRQLSPVRVGTLGAGVVIADISAGGGHSVALAATGEVWAWGDNRVGQLGLGYTSMPFEDDLFFQRRATAAPIMVDRPQRLTAWDYTQDGVLITGRSNAVLGGRIVMAQAGVAQTVALTEHGEAWVWGSNAAGELGTCGCGACAAYYAAAGSCAPVQSGPPPPPPPPLLDAEGLVIPAPPPPPPAPPPGTASTVASNVTNATCTCACPGHGNTCATGVVVASDGTSSLVNVGVCVAPGDGGPTTCECTAPYVTLTGTISTHDVPMPLNMSGFTFESVAAGGALFAVSVSACAEDANGRACANSGTCVTGADGVPSCSCYQGYAGVACEYQCLLGTRAELASVIQNSRAGYKALFPGGLYDPQTEGNFTGLVCSGHGNCTGAQGCVCETGWQGDHCQLMCPRNNEKAFCSGHGTCKYDATIDALPFCECEHYTSAAACAAAGLFYREQGACAYFDAALGFDACLTLGLCGICQDGARAVRHALATALAAAAWTLLAAL